MHPVMGKVLLAQFTPVQVAWMRYGSAFLAYWAFVVGRCLFFSKSKRSSFGRLKEFVVFSPSGRDNFLIFFLGAMAFCFSPLIQNLGLAQSLASENAMIVAMEPVVTAAFAWLLLKENVNSADIVAYFFAFLGFVCLASPETFSGTAQSTNSHFLGNFLILISLLGEAVYSILGKKLSGTYSPLALFGSALTFGVACLIGVVSYIDDRSVALHFSQMDWKSILAILWIGPLGTAGGYLYYMFALSESSVVSTALLLFLQPLAGTFFGFFFMGDQFKLVQSVGSGLILFALLLSYAYRLKKRPSH
jgi:drug/metabolite transporter (DMT)-like permease